MRTHTTAAIALCIALTGALSTSPRAGAQNSPLVEGVTGLPQDISSLLSLAGIWQPVADANVTPENHGLAVDFAANLRLHNGREGLIFTGWSFAGFTNADARIVPVHAAMLEQQPDGTLQLATARYLPDAVTNGAGSVVIADFNRDGIDDVFLASWNEAPHIAASSTAFLSNRTAYDRIAIKDFTYAHGANVAEIDGRPTVFTAAYYRAPDHGNTVAYFDGVNDFTVIPDTGLVSASSVAVADFYGDGTNAIVFGDLSFGPGIPFNRTNPGIYLYQLRGLLPVGNPFKIATPYFDGKPEYASFPSFTDPTKTHAYRVWVDDFNQDKQLDVVAQAMIWHADRGAQKDMIQMLQNDGEYRFRDLSDTLNPDYSQDCYQHEYQPQMRATDGSGIKAYFFASPSYETGRAPCNYVMMNDGTGRLHVALHETLNVYGEQILKWLPGRLPAGHFVQSAPLLRAYQTPNSRWNFVAMAKAAFVRGSDPYIVRFVFVNLPLQLDLAAQFTRPITVMNLNGSRNIRTLAGDDVIHVSGAGGATIDGGAGFNTVVYPGPRSGYVATGRNTSWEVSRVNAPTRDTLVRIQRIQFDGEVSPIR